MKSLWRRVNAGAQEYYPEQLETADIPSRASVGLNASVVPTIEVHDGEPQLRADSNGYRRGQYALNFSTRTALGVSLAITLIIIAITVFVISTAGKRTNDQSAQSSASVPAQSIQLAGPLSQESSNSLLQSEPAEALLVNGNIITRGSIKISGGAYVTVLKPVTLTNNRNISLPDASGTVCLDSNNCNYATNKDLQTTNAALQTANSGLQTATTKLAQLQSQLGQIIVPTIPPATTVNGSAGAISIQGASNQIAVTTANGIISLATPQDIAPISSPTFAGMLLNGNLAVTGTVTLPLDCSSQINGGKLTTDAAGHVICGGDASGGAGGAVTTSGGTSGTLAMFTGAQTIADSVISQALGVVTISGDMTVSGALAANSLTLTSALSVPNGGTGAISFTPNGVIYGNGAGALGTTAAPASGQVIIGDGSGIPQFTTLSGDVTLTGAGVTTIQANSVALGTDTTGNYVDSLGALNGLSVVGNGGEGSTPALSVVYGTTAGTSVQGNTTATVTAGSNLTGGGTITLGAGGSITLNVSSSPTFSGNINAQGGMVTLGTAAVGGSIVINDGAGHIGTFQTAALGQDVVYTVPDPGGVSASFCLSSGNCAAAGTAGGDLTGTYPNPTIARLQGTNLSVTGLAAGHVLIYNATNSRWENHILGGDITVSETGIVAIQPNSVALGSDTTGSYVDSIGTLTGLSATGNSGEGSTPALSVLYGSVADTAVQGDTTLTITAGTGMSGGGTYTLGAGGNAATLNVTYGSVLGTAVQGNITLTCPSGTGNLSGGGGTITLGTGGSCGNLSITGSPTFATSVTTPSLILTGAGSNATINVASLGQPTTYTLPDPGAGTVTICLSTGNCPGDGAGTGAAGGDLTGTYPNPTIAKLQGSTLNISSPAAGNVLIYNGTNSRWENHAVSGDMIISDTGVVTIAANSVALGTDTTGNYVDSLGTLTGLSATGNTGEGSTPTLSVVYGSGANAAVQGNTTATVAAGTNLTGGGSITLGAGGTVTLNVTSSPNFSGSLTAQGSAVTVGTNTQQGTLVLNDGSNNTGTIETAALGQNTTYTLPDPGASGAATICLSTGNCAGSGGGVTAAGGTTDRLSKFSGANAITDSSISDNGSTVTLNGTVNLVIQGGTGTFGTATQAGTLKVSDGSSNTVSIVAAGQAADRTYTLPDVGADATFCLSTGNCVGGGSGGAPNAAAYLVASLDGTLTNERALAAGNNVTITDGGANGNMTVATVQNPSFTTSVTTPILQSSNGLTISSAAGNTVAISSDTAINLQSDTNVTGNLDVSGGFTSGTANAFTIDSSGAITAATGIVSSGTIRFSGYNCLANANGGKLTTDASGNLTCADDNGGSGSAISGSGTNGALAMFTAGQVIGDSNITKSGSTITITGTLNITNALAVGQGGTGATSFTGNGLLYGNGSGAIQVTAAGTSGQVLVASASGAPAFVSFSGDVTVSDTGATTIANGAITSAKIADGTVTGTDIAANTVANNNLVNSSLTITAGNGLGGGGVVSLGGSTSLNVLYGSAANTAVQGNTTVTITAGTGLTGGSTITLGSGGSSTLDVAYGSALGTAVQGNTTLTCASGTGNLTGGGGTITLGAGGSCGNVSIINNPTFTTSVTTPSLVFTGAGSNGTLQIASLGQATAYTLPDPGASGAATICLSTGNCAAAGSAGGDLTGTYPNPTVAKLQGSVLNISSPVAGHVLIYNGTNSRWENHAISGDITVSDTGVVTIANSSVTSAKIADGTITGTDIASTTVTNTNLVNSTLTVTAGNGLSGGGSVALGSSTSLAVSYGSSANTAVQGNTSLTVSAGTNLTGGGTVTLGTGGTVTVNVTSSPNFSGTLTAQGSSVTVGNATTQGTLVLNDGAGKKATIQSATLGQDTAYTLPDPGASGAATICLSTGNCAGTGGGVTTGGGTADRLSKFTAGSAIGNSSISDNGSTVTLNGSVNLVIQGGTSTLGTTTQSGTLSISDGSNNTISVVASSVATNYTFTLPNTGADATFCMSTGNCVGGGSGGAPNAAAYLVASLDGTLTNERALAAGSNVTVTDGGANGNMTVATVNNPTFSASVTTPQLQSSNGLTISSAAGNTVAVSAGTTIELQSDTNVTGGLDVSGGFTSGTANAFTIDASGAITAATGITSSGTIRFSGYNCFANANGGKLTTDASGNLICGDDNGGSGSAISGSGTNGTLAMFTAGQVVGDSNITKSGSTITITGTLNITNALAVDQGGTGATSFTSNGVLYGNGSSALSVTSAGTSGQVLVANASGIPTFVSFSGDVTVAANGATTIANSSITSAKIADGTITGTDIASSTVANSNLANSSITVTAGNGLSGGGSASLGGSTSLAVAYGSAANTAVQGNTTLTITAGTGLTGGSTITLGAGGTSTLSVTYGSVLGTAVQGNTTLTCASGTGNLSGGGGSITLGAGGSCGNLSITNSPTFTTSVTTPSLILNGATNNGTIQVASGLGQPTTYTIPDPGQATASFCLSTGNCPGDGAGTGAAGGDLTGTYPNPTIAKLQGYGLLLSTPTAGHVLIYNGTNSRWENHAISSDITISETGVVTIANGVVTGAKIANATITGSNIASGTVTNGNLVNSAVTVTAGNGLNGGGAVSLGSSTSLSVAYGNVANTAVQGNTTATVTAGTNLTGGGSITLGAGGTVTLDVTNSPSFSGTLTVQGATATVGTATQQGGLVLYDGSSNTGTIQTGALAQNTVYTLPDPGVNTASICLSTGNCAATGTAGGDLTGTYPNPTIASLQGSTLTISSAASGQVLNYNGTAWVNTGSPTISGNLTVQGTGVSSFAGSVQLVGSGTRPASPSEGTLYYDTSAKQLVVYANGKWQADRSTATKIVAASTASQALKDAADYVATGTSDQTVINTALTAASGGRVYLTEGTYTIDGTINVPTGTVLAGAGASTIIKVKNATNATLNYIIYANGGTRVTIQDLAIDGNKSNQTAGDHTGIYSTDTETRITGVYVANIYSASISSLSKGILLTGGYSTITGSVIENNGSNGVNISGSYMTISNNVITGNAGNGLVPSGSNDAITGNTISSNNGRGIGDINGITLANSTITGNAINSNSYGIDLSDFGGFLTNVTVSGNTISNNSGTGIYLYDLYGSGYPKNVTIIGNTINNNSSGIVISGGSAPKPTGNVISNNTLAGNTTSISDSGSATIWSNQLDGNGNLVNKGVGALTVGTSTVGGTLSVQGGVTVSQLATPSAPTITRSGLAGSTSYSYAITALDGVGETLASGNGTMATGYATLSGANYNIITWNKISGATSYKVYRTASGGTPATTGLIATVTASGTSTQSFNDMGFAASGSVPVSNTTGSANFAGLIQGSSSLSLGTASAVNGTIVLKNNTNGNAVTIQSPTQSTGSYTATIPSLGANDTFCMLTLANCGGSLTDLQTAYNNDVNGGDVTIALTAADGSLIFSNPSSGGSASAYVLTVNQQATGAVGGLDIQSAGTGNLLTVTDTTATAADVLTIANDGVTTFKNRVDSASAFRVQNYLSNPVLTVDTSDNEVAIGGAPLGTGYRLTVQGAASVGYVNSIGAFDVKTSGGASTLFQVDTSPSPGLSVGTIVNGNYYLGSGATRTVAVTPASSGVGSDLVVAGGQGASGQTGGNLYLQAGANGTANGTPGSVFVKANGGNSASAFQVQNASAAVVLNVSTAAVSATTSLVQIGATAITGGNSNGTYLGANPGTFTGNFIDLQVGNSSKFKVTNTGALTLQDSITIPSTSTMSLQYNVSLQGTVTAQSGGSNQYGLQNEPRFQPAAAITGAIYGLVNSATLQSSSFNVSKLVGSHTHVAVNSTYTGGAITNGVYGFEVGAPQTDTSIALGTYGGIYVNGNGVNGNGMTSGTVTNYQLRVSGITSTQGAASTGTLNNYGINLTVPSSGTNGTNNNYGLYVTGNGGTGGTTTNYAIYSDSTAQSMINGNLSLGSAAGSGGLTNNGTTLNYVNAQTLGSSMNPLTQAWIDNYTAISINATATSLSFVVPAPTTGTAGKVFYVSAASSSNSFTLTPTGTSGVNLTANTTAALVWNGSSWSYLGVNSGTLQSMYNNSLSPEIVLSPGSSPNTGITIRDNGTTPVVGNLLEVQNAAGTASYLGVSTSSINLFGTPNGEVSSWATTTNALSSVPRRYTGAFVANGYIFAIDGADSTGVVSSNIVSARINANGSVGTWSSTTATGTLPAREKDMVVYANGYAYVLGGDDGAGTPNNQSTVYYAKVNNDGTIGSWAPTTSMNARRVNAAAVYANGYIFVMGGCTTATGCATPVNTVETARVNADGTLSSWTTLGSGSNLNTAVDSMSATVANGYVYLFGSSSGATNTTVQYVPVNSNGTLGSWATTTSLPAGYSRTSAVVSNGYVYLVGGTSSAAAQKTVLYGQLSSAGTISSWVSEPSAQQLPTARTTGMAVTYNGYIYSFGGTSNTGSTMNPDLHYTSTARVQIGANLDLVGVQGGTLSNGGDPSRGAVGGSITAGNIKSVGNLEVSGQTNLQGSLSVAGAVSFSSQLYVGGRLPSAALSSTSLSGSNGYNVKAVGKYVYVTATGGMNVYDVTNPASPVALGTVALGWSAYGLAINGHYAYVAIQNQGQLRAVDISDPNAMVDLSGLTGNNPATFNGGNVASMQVQGHYLYMVDGYNLRVYDISRPEYPSLISPLDATTAFASNDGKELVVKGKYAYVAYASGLKIYDVSNPAAPAIVSTLSGYFNVDGLAVEGHYAYISDQFTGLITSINIAVPGSPAAVSSVSAGAQPQNIVVEGRTAYTVNKGDNTMSAIDISNPASMVLVGTTNTATAQPSRVDVQGRYAYVVTDSGTDFETYDIGGTYTQSLEAGSAEVTDMSVDGSLIVSGVAQFNGGFASAQGAQIQGDLSVRSQTGSTSAFQVQNSAGTSYLNVSTSTLPNLIANPSFESGNTNGWQIRSGATMTVDGQNMKYGAAALDVATGSTNGAGVQYNTGLLPNTTYSLNFWARRDSGTSGNFSVGRAENGTDTDCLTAITFNATWWQFSCTFTTGATVGTSPNIYIKQTDTSTDSIWLDGFSLIASSSPQDYAPAASGVQVDPYYSNISLNAGVTGELQPWRQSTSTLTAALSRSAVVTANGYIYVMGGGTGTDGTGTRVATVQSAKVNADGSLGSFTNVSNSLGTAVSGAGAVVANGYVYVIDGIDNTGTVVNTVQYARLNSDGTTGSWSTTTGPAALHTAGAVTANGYIYVVGGCSNAGCSTHPTAIYYAKVNADGSLSSWTTSGSVLSAAFEGSQPVVANGYMYVVGTNGNANLFTLDPVTGAVSNRVVMSGLSVGREDGGAIAANGYLYIIGGYDTSGGAVKNTYDYAHLDSDGNIPNTSNAYNWTTGANSMPDARGRENVKAVVVNGYVYLVGGDNGTANVSTVYYASLPRVQVSGALDLVGNTSQNLNNAGQTGGQLTAGNTLIAGTFDVQQAANFSANVSISGNLVVDGQFAVDVANSKITIGKPGGDTTGTLLVLGTKTNAGDPTGAAGAMYYNASSGSFRCYQYGGWQDCARRARNGLYVYSDFVSKGSDNYFQDSSTGTGATVSGSAATPLAGHPGIIRLMTGTTTTGAADEGDLANFILGNGDAYIFESDVYLPALSNGTDTFTVRSGFRDQQFAESTDGCFFRYTNGTNSGRWQGVCRNNNVESVCDTGIAVAATTWYRLNVNVNAAGTSADFQTDGASRCQITTNIPTGSTRYTGYGSNIVKSAGTTTSYLDVDYMEIIGTLATPR